MALRAAKAEPLDSPTLEQLAQVAVDEGEEDRALPLIEQALEKSPSARLWQWKGLVERSIDEHEQALASFAEAARLDPSDVSIAHGHARIAMEAGVDAQSLYERALALAPQNGPMIVGLAAARAAAGNGEQGAAELEAMLDRAP